MSDRDRIKETVKEGGTITVEKPKSKPKKEAE